MSAPVVKVPPGDIRHKLTPDADLEGSVGGDWDLNRRVALQETDKHRSIVQRYVGRLDWIDTELFRNQYTTRLGRGETVRGCGSIEELAAQYHDRMDALFENLKRDGFRAEVCGREVPIPDAYLGRDGAVLLGNNGNHRVAMAKVLNLPHVLLRIKARHSMLDGPIAYSEVKPIPAMTTAEERARYYARAKEMAGDGAIIEFGSWLGASTASLAAAVRDSGVPGLTVHTYDRFAWKPEHSRKAREFYGHAIEDLQQSVDCLDEFKNNLGDLLPFVTVHKGEIKRMRWTGGPIGFVLFDAPKRVPEISLTLTELTPALERGAVMAWQDFAHFPSYEIVACLSRLMESGNVKFLEAVYPGTTVILKLRKAWRPEQVSADALALRRWGATKIVETWNAWGELLPEAMRPRFMCGAAMFLCDIGEADHARAYLRVIKEMHADAIRPKWVYLREHRANLLQRYAPLAAEMFG